MSTLHDDDEHDRLTRLLRPDRRERARLKLTGHRRAFILRWTRLLLPISALGIVAVVIAWPQMDKARTSITPVPRDEILPQTIGKNELINPRFESEDEQSQPYTIIAESATQDNTNPDLVILHNPKADFQMRDGAWVAGEAETGHYQQDSRTLKLEGRVKLFENQGYVLNMPTLDLDMNTRRATTSEPVSGHGPAGTIAATGLDADAATGTLIFTGPAVLTLNTSVKGLPR